MLTRTYKVYNRQLNKSVKLTGYHLLKDLSRRGEKVGLVKLVKLGLQRNITYTHKQLTIDLQW